MSSPSPSPGQMNKMNESHANSAASASPDTAATASVPVHDQALAPASKRQRPAVITVTPRAAARVKSLLEADAAGSSALRIGVKARGCTGLSYTFEYCSEPLAGDEVVELSGSQKGPKVIVDSKACIYLIGSELDYIEDVASSRFVFSNPNAKGQCGCGESFHA